VPETPEEALSAEIERAARLLAPAERLVVTTGAGMSKESGIPTFRDAPNALWKDYDPEELATPEGFLRNPPLVWRWYAARREMIARAAPHAGHVALAELEKLYDDFVLLTQNIDNLHRVAGTVSLVELHGNIFRYKCFDRHHPVDELPAGDEEPPRCHCGSPIRPDVVWYGEMLAQSAVDRAFAALEACDVILVVGTSGLVYPTAGFPSVARRAGARVIEVNPEPTPITMEADVFLRAGARAALPPLVERVAELRGE
jgi:NAD-dependent deacetylase